MPSSLLTRHRPIASRRDLDEIVKAHARARDSSGASGCQPPRIGPGRSSPCGGAEEAISCFGQPARQHPHRYAGAALMMIWSDLRWHRRGPEHNRGAVPYKRWDVDGSWPESLIALRHAGRAIPSGPISGGGWTADAPDEIRRPSVRPSRSHRGLFREAIGRCSSRASRHSAIAVGFVESWAMPPPCPEGVIFWAVAAGFQIPPLLLGHLLLDV